jgi:hypothetical protein
MSEEKIPERGDRSQIIGSEILKKQIPVGIYILLGVLCFVPMIGCLAGLIMIIAGIVHYKDKILIILGACGVAFTIFIYSTLFYTVEHSELFKEGFNEIAKIQLKTLVKDIEFYKIQNGTYPASLKVLEQGEYSTSYTDPALAFANKGVGDVYFYYPLNK